ncbi:MAG: CoA-binding protein [Bauldia sp.]
MPLDSTLPHPVNHDAYPDAYVRSILTSVKTVAMVGASDNESRPSFFVLKYLINKRYRVFPINPGIAGKMLLGQMVYGSLAEVPVPIDLVDVFRKPEAIPAVVEQALALDPKPKVIWLQLGLRDDAAAARAEAAGVRVIMNRCMKIEYGRLCGEIGWMGVNSRTLSSKKPILRSTGFQHLDLDAKD